MKEKAGGGISPLSAKRAPPGLTSQLKGQIAISTTYTFRTNELRTELGFLTQVCFRAETSIYRSAPATRL